MRFPTFSNLFILILACFFLFVSFSGCKDENHESKIVLPDVRSAFARQLAGRDSTLILDSFNLVGIDTMTQQSGLIHERYPFLRTLGRISRAADSMRLVIGMEKIPMKDDLDNLKTFEEELAYVHHVLDSLNTQIRTADSVEPTGYRAVYKVTVRKPGGFTVSDSIVYAIDSRQKLVDWEGNVAKDIDSLSMGRHPRSVNYRRKH